MIYLVLVLLALLLAVGVNGWFIAGAAAICFVFVACKQIADATRGNGF